MLSACGGGGGGGVASTPPPPAPPPIDAGVTSVEVQTSWIPSPATRAGSYGLIATTNGGASTGFQLDVAKSGAAFAYALRGPSDFLPAGLGKIGLPTPIISWDFNAGGPNYRYDNPYGDTAQYFGQNLKEYDVYSDGTKKLREDYDFGRASIENALVDVSSNQYISESLLFDVGLSYVSMGEWSWQAVTIDPDGTARPTGATKSVYFAYGDRTPSSGIPASGTATYDAHTMSDLLFSLTADFGERSISTELSQPSVFDVSGSAPFNNDGSFNIPLSGTAGAQAASGDMNGAFFGPHAEQVGGTLALDRADGSLLLQDAFVGQQHPH
jgi:hypothetical protein